MIPAPRRPRLMVIEQHAKAPVFGSDHWREDGDLQGLRGDPRWKALLEKHPLPSTEKEPR